MCNTGECVGVLLWMSSIYAQTVSEWSQVSISHHDSLKEDHVTHIGAHRLVVVTLIFIELQVFY